MPMRCMEGPRSAGWGNIFSFNLPGPPSHGWDELLCQFPGLSFLTTCSDHSKPYVILTALDESYKNHQHPRTGRSQRVGFWEEEPTKGPFCAHVEVPKNVPHTTSKPLVSGMRFRPYDEKTPFFC